MTDDRWSVRYEQLNERARWYTSQLWYIPAAYVGVTAIAADKVDALQPSRRLVGLIMLILLSFATYVHVLSVKHYERRAVAALRDLEAPEHQSEGGAPWYLSVSTYLRLIPLIGAVTFAWLVTEQSVLPWEPCTWVRAILPVLVALAAGGVAIADAKRRTSRSALRSESPHAPVPTPSNEPLQPTAQ